MKSTTEEFYSRIQFRQIVRGEAWRLYGLDQNGRVWRFDYYTDEKTCKEAQRWVLMELG